MKIKNECEHIGAREPARRLRLKILEMLKQKHEPIILDFEGIGGAGRTPSSSFLDELFGKLVVELGLENFKRLIKPINMESLVVKMANTAISERIASTDKDDLTKKN